MTTQLNVRLPDVVISEINELAEEYGSQAKVLITAVSKLKKEIEIRRITMNRNEMVKNLKSLGLSDAISDQNASVNGTPAILLRWNEMEEYYIGKDIYIPGEDLNNQNIEHYRNWLTDNFKD